VSDAGRYQLEDRADQAFTPRALKGFVESPLAGLGGVPDPSARAGLKWNLRHVWLMVLLGLGLAGFALLLKPSPPARRVLLLPAAAALAYVAAVPLSPLLYLPARYQVYPLAIAAW
jgi:hypothetical protein